MLSIKASSKHNSSTDIVDEKACCANPKHEQQKLFTAKDVLALTNSKTLIEILTQFVKNIKDNEGEAEFDAIYSIMEKLI